MNENLPRLLHDPDSGIVVIEFLRLSSVSPMCVDRRIIMGVLVTDIQNEKK